MPEINLDRLRGLRQRAEDLLNTLVSDLRPFQHKTKTNGFVRTPDSSSDPDDVNVTTSCSCLMALALTGKFNELYPDEPNDTAFEIFQNLIRAPWMSSGLSENNAFTTTLVLRATGFLMEAKLLASAKVNKSIRPWEPHLQITNLLAFTKRLKGNYPASKYLFSLFSRKSQKIVNDFIADGKKQDKVQDSVINELERIIGTTVLYEKSRFNKVTLSNDTRALIALAPDGYSVARLNRLLIHDLFSGCLVGLRNLSLRRIASEMSDDIARFKINDYPPAAAVIYWFVDGIARARLSLPEARWTHLCGSATTQFNKERSLVLAGHAAMMDPVAMAMAACLCSRLRAMCEHPLNVGVNKKHLELLPSRAELEHSIKELFKKQSDGIWPKYFPLFHYQDAGSNFCFTFELLEAVLCEFGRLENNLLDDVSFVNGLEDALVWCEKNRTYSQPFSGWNSGGNLKTLKKGQPESWATAVVHMFLWELSHVLSVKIQAQIKKQYHARILDPKASTISSLIDIEISEKGHKKSLNEILQKQFINNYRKENEETLRIRSIKAPRSALLFGPPGTSKTKVTEAIAGDLGWPLIQIDPSHFLKNGLDGIYLQSDTIFKDLLDLAGVIVLFDEMDALVQTRDSSLKLDTAAQFLTTYMLPKLTALHDHGRVLFYMATNFQERFDAAIKRTGRFDLLLCMGPPTMNAKLTSLHKFVGSDDPNSKKITETSKAIHKLLANKHKTKVQLELYTFGEFLSFVKTIACGRGENGLYKEIKKMDPESFEQMVNQDSKYVGLRIVDLAPLGKLGVPKWDEWKSLADLDDLAFSRKTFKDKESERDITPIIRYLLDRRESKQQG